MTLSPPDVLLGAQTPRVEALPASVTSAGEEAVEFCDSIGLDLDPWQRYVIRHSLGERADGKWAAFEVGMLVPRQNGKGAVLEARELAGLFLFDERLILHSAHEFKTAAEAFRRVLFHVENNDDLRKRVKKVRTSHGEEGIELTTGARLRFVARSTGSGRGFSGDTVILDEAYNLASEGMAALLPTLSARPNPQIWYTSSAGMETSIQLRKVRERGIAGTSSRLAFFEWSADGDADLDDRQAWAQANPALGIRIGEEFVESERDAMDDDGFARERLGLWAEFADRAVINSEQWARLIDPRSQIVGLPAFAVDMPWDRSSVTVAAGGRRSDGQLHCELIDQRPGTSWAVQFVREKAQRWRPCAVLLDGSGPAASMRPELEQALSEVGVELIPVPGAEMARACGAFYDAVTQDGIRHLGDERLAASLAGAKKSDRGDVWRWDRKDSRANIAPLVAVTLAVHGAVAHGDSGGAPSLW